MGKVLGILMIATGGMILLNIILMAVGGLKIMMGLMMPISFKLMPLNQKLLAWVDVPLSMGLAAYLNDIQPYSEEGYIAGGLIDFKVTLTSGGPEDDDIEAVPVIFIQEDAEIDEIQRYVLRIGPLNYPSIISWFLALGSIGGLLIAVVWRIKVRGKGSSGGKEKGDPAAVAPEPPSPEVVSVIPLDDEEEVEKA